MGNQIEKSEMDGACSTMRDSRGPYRVLMGRPEGKKPLGRLRHRWDYNIKMYFQKVGW
jgi:hypothetical protein